MKAAIFDLDGTITNIDHRVHHVSGRHRDWPTFNALMDYDTPNAHIINLMDMYINNSEYQVVICTGRFKKYSGRTISWLRKHNIKYDMLFMRPDGDYGSDSVTKGKMLDEISKLGFFIEIAFDDRDSVVEMMRDRAIPCMQVKAGGY